jgi:hypothetical protein
MGNSQSREENWKIFKITGSVHKYDKSYSWFRYELDDYVSYKDGNYKYIDLDKETASWFPTVCSCGLGDYLKIDLNITSLENSGYTFGSGKFRVISAVGKEMVIERLDNDGNILRTVAEYMGEAGEARQRHQAYIEWGRSTNNSLWKPTSWDMPPGWK